MSNSGRWEANLVFDRDLATSDAGAVTGCASSDAEGKEWNRTGGLMHLHADHNAGMLAVAECEKFTDIAVMLASVEIWTY